MSRERGEKAGDRGDRLERSERGGDRGDRLDRARTPATKRSFSKEVEERSRERPSQPDGLRKAASLTEDRDRGREAGKGPGEGKRRVWAGLGPTTPVSCTEYVAEHTLFTWLITHLSRDITCTDHVALMH